MSNIHRLSLVVGVLKEDLPITVEDFINAEPDYSIEVQFGDQLYAGIEDITQSVETESGKASTVKLKLTDGREFTWTITNGLSAYQVAKAIGFTGTVDEWLESLIGPKGEKGDKGDKGNKGDTGPRGEMGDGLHIDGVYDSLSTFVAAHPTGKKGEYYVVNGYLYGWSDATKEWVNGGRIQGAKGDKGYKGDALKYSDLTEDEKNDLRSPLNDIAEKAREHAEESAYQSFLAKRSADVAKESSESSMAAIDSINESIARIVEMGGEDVDDILASLDVMMEIANIKSQLAILGPLYPHEIFEDDWDRMTPSQQKLIKETFTTLYIVEGSSEKGGGYIFHEGILTLSPNCTFEDGVLTLADYTFENGIITLNQ